MTIAAALLAAGGGSRFAGPTHKLLAPLRGRPVVAHALANMAASHLTPAAVVTGAAELAGLVPDGIAVLVNPDWAEGQATSLSVALRWAADRGCEAVVVGLGDQPAVGPEAWQRVGAATGTPIAVATYGGRRGNPVRLAREIWDRLPATGDVGARAFMADHPDLVAEVPCEGDPADVDTMDDLARAEDGGR